MLDRSYRAEIDGLRAIAILSVVLYHARVPLIIGGFTGVDIFFVISGYLIGGQIYSELRAGNFSYMRFYQRRAKRILPAFYGVLLFTMLAALFILTPSEAKEFGRSAFAATLSVSNLLFWKITSYFNPTNELNPLLMTWSLGVEEQFYAVIPLLMALLVRIRRGFLMPAIVVACALSFISAWRELGKQPVFVFYMLPARAWELGLGVALAVAELNRPRAQRTGPLVEVLSVAGLVLILAPVFFLASSTPFPGPAALPSVLGAALTLAVPSSWINRRLLSMPPLVFVGRVSYSWYLWHWPLLAFAHILYGENMPLAESVVVVSVALAAAVLSYVFLEQPLRKSLRAPAPLLLRYAAVSILALAACAAVWRARGFPQRFPSLIAVEEQVNTEPLYRDPCLVWPGTDEPNLSSVCSDPTADRSDVALWGDSHAAALAPGLAASAHAQGYGFVQLNKAACLPLIGAFIYNPRAPLEEAACSHYNLEALNILKTNQHIRVVILAGFWQLPLRGSTRGRGGDRWWLTSDSGNNHVIPTLDASREILKDGLIATIQSLRQAGKHVFVIGDVPNFDFDPVSRFRTESIPARRALAVWIGAPDAGGFAYAPQELAPEAAIAASALKQAVAGFSSGVALVDLTPEICSATDKCSYRDGDRLLYFDSDHLTAFGARYALRDFRLPTLGN
jgi:peptidoglycan/LPS O-acetylase OafA/YrhL